MRKSNERGITLVALVVTIVVLLILAGITITYVLSDNGIFKRANDAETETRKGEVYDAMVSVIADLSVEPYAPTIELAEGDTEPTLAQYIDFVKNDLPTGMKETFTATAIEAKKGTGVKITGSLTYKDIPFTITYDGTTLEVKAPETPATPAE